MGSRTVLIPSHQPQNALRRQNMLTDAGQVGEILLGDPGIPMLLQDLASIIHTSPSIGYIQLGLLVSRRAGEQARHHPLFLHKPTTEIDTLLLSISVDERLVRIVRSERFEVDWFRRVWRRGTRIAGRFVVGRRGGLEGCRLITSRARVGCANRAVFVGCDIDRPHQTGQQAIQRSRSSGQSSVDCTADCSNQTAEGGSDQWEGFGD